MRLFSNNVIRFFCRSMVSLIEVKEFRRGVGAGAVGGARTLLWVFSFVFVLPMVLVSVFLK